MLPPVIAPSRAFENRLSTMPARKDGAPIQPANAWNHQAPQSNPLQFSGRKHPLRQTLAAALGLIGVSTAQLPSASAGQALDLRLPDSFSIGSGAKLPSGGLDLTLPKDYDPSRINVPGNLAEMIKDTIRQLTGGGAPDNVEEGLLMLTSIAEQLTGKNLPIPASKRAEVLHTLLYGGNMPGAIPDALIPEDVRGQLPDIPLTNARVSPAELNGIKLVDLRPHHVKVGKTSLPRYGEAVWKNMRGLVDDVGGAGRDLFDLDKLTVQGLPAKQVVEDAIRLLRDQGMQPDKVDLPLVLSLASAFKLEDLRYDGKTLKQLADDPSYKDLLTENGHFKSLVDLLKVLQDPDNITINGVKLKDTRLTVEAKLTSVMRATPLDPVLKGKKLAPGETGGEMSIVLAATPVEVTTEPQADGHVTGVTGVALKPSANVGLELLGVHRWDLDSPLGLYTSLAALFMPKAGQNAPISRNTVSPYGYVTMRFDPVYLGLNLGKGFELTLRPLGIQADYGRDKVDAVAQGSWDRHGTDWRVDIQHGTHNGVIVSHVMDGALSKTWGTGTRLQLGGGVIQDKNGPGTKGGGERPIEPFAFAELCQQLGLKEGDNLCLSASGSPDFWGGYPAGTVQLRYAVPFGTSGKK